MLTLQVQNFGPIKKADVKLRPLTVFIGPNNAGKSYLALLRYALYNPFGRASSLGVFLGPRKKSQMRISDKDKTATRALLQERMKNGRELKVSDLPNAVQHDIKVTVDNLFKELPRLLSLEVQRCFASELDDLVRMHANDCKLIIKGDNPPFEIEIAVSGKRFKLLRKSLDIRNAPISGIGMEHFSFDTVTTRLASIVFVRFLGELANNSICYLPAARSGILQGHKLLAKAVLSRMPLIGIEPIDIPRLSGIVADFIGNLLEIETKEPPRDISEIAEFIEKEVCKGKIERKAADEKVEFPEIYYKLNGKKIPLYRTSSMVSEIAPLVLFLKFLVRRGDLLIIEEPEAHLHPDIQRVVARAIVRLIRTGVRVMVTTHSDYFVQQISNFILMARLSEERQRLGYAANDYLNAEEVSAYLFQMESDQSGSTTRELEVTQAAGIPEDEFIAIAESIYKESAMLEQPH